MVVLARFPPDWTFSEPPFTLTVVVLMVPPELTLSLAGLERIMVVPPTVPLTVRLPLTLIAAVLRVPPELTLVVAPEATLSVLPPIAPVPPMIRLPELTFVDPVYVLTLLSVTDPEP